jgi:hypothetical protein
MPGRRKAGDASFATPGEVRARLLGDAKLIGHYTERTLIGWVAEVVGAANVLFCSQPPDIQQFCFLCTTTKDGTATTSQAVVEFYL